MALSAQDLHGTADQADVVLRLYVRTGARACTAAETRVRLMGERYLAGRFRLEVVDLGMDPHRAEADGILVVPTLVRLHPLPVRRLIGDLTEPERTLRGLFPGMPAAGGSAA